MLKLLHAGIRKYFKSIVFRVCFALTAVCGIINGYNTRKHTLDGIYIFVQLIIYVVAVIWISGKENEEGIFRNKIVVGHDKGKIFLSELIVGAGICGALFLVHTLLFAVFNSYIFTTVSIEAIIKMFIDLLIVHIALGAIFATLSCLTPHRAISGIIAVVFVFGTFIASSNLQYCLETEEEFIPKKVLVTHEYFDENGELYTESEWIETDEKEKNPEYIDEPLRTVLYVAYRLLPLSHIIDATELTDNYLGYMHFGAKDIIITVEDFILTDEITDMLNKNLIYSVILLFGTTAIGYIGFRRKEFK